MEKQIDFNGKKIVYHVYGEGNPVVLIHGFGEDSNVWKNQLSLQDKYFLIIPDIPGSGKSEMIDDMSMEGMAEVIKAIINNERNEPSSKENSQQNESSEVLRFGKPASPAGRDLGWAGSLEWAGLPIIGHSMGGYITLAFAEKYPQYLNGFALFHSTSYPDSEEKKVTRQKGIEFMKQHGGFEFLKTAVPNLFSPVSKVEMKETIDEFIQSLSNFSTESLVSYYEAMMQRPDRTSLLKNQPLPVLFIGGKHDTAVPLNDVLEQCHLPGKSYFHVLENSGHMGMMEEVTKANEALLEFLEDLFAKQ